MNLRHATIAAAILLGVLGAPGIASAARDADAPERAALTATTAVVDSCLVGHVSVEDTSWASASNSCDEDAGTGALQRGPDGAYALRATVFPPEACPVVGVPENVALDLGLCGLDDVIAARVATQELTSIYKMIWSKLPRHWVACSPDIADDSTGLAAGAWCEMEFLRGRAFTGGSFRIDIKDAGITSSALHTRKYTKLPKTCSIASSGKTFPSGVQITDRKLRSPASLPCVMVKSATSLIPAIDKLAASKSPKRTPKRLTVNAPSPNGPGFEARTQLTCVVSGSGMNYNLTCKNKLADAFAYNFTVKPKPAPKPVAPKPPTSGGSSGGSGCHPSYTGACLKQGAGDYDCEGGSGNGPNYTGPVTVVGPDEFDLDRDGDGSACE